MIQLIIASRNKFFLIVSPPVKRQERRGVPDTVRHGEHHHRLAQSLNGHHTATGEMIIGKMIHKLRKEISILSRNVQNPSNLTD